MSRQSELDAEIAGATDRAARTLKAALAYHSETYASIAPRLGITASSLSSQVQRRSLAAFQRIANVFPPALLVAADLFQEIANIYRREHERLTRADVDANSGLEKPDQDMGNK